MVQRLYQSYVQPFVRVVQGVPTLWDSNAASRTRRITVNLTAWSPCNKFIAIHLFTLARVDILDPVTLQRLQSLEYPQDKSWYPAALVFSPDSRILTASIRPFQQPPFVVSWDLQTGGVISAVELGEPLPYTELSNVQMTYSMDGRTVITHSRYESSTIISVCDVFSGTPIPDLDLGTLYVYKIWAHGESLRFATLEPTGITIWEVGFSPEATPTEVETISIPAETVATFVFTPKSQGDFMRTQFHPGSYRLAFIDIKETLLVWDARVSKFLLHCRDTGFRSAMTFSSDGNFFACATLGSEVPLWKWSPTGYTLFQKLATDALPPRSLLSPNGESIVTFGGRTIQLWHTKRFTTPTSNILSQTLPNEPLLVGIPSDGTFAVTARKGGNTATVIDLKSGVLHLTINTSINIHGLESNGNTIVVIGAGKAIIWTLPEGNFLPGARMGIKDSTRTINFGSTVDHGILDASISLDFRYIALLRLDPMGDLNNLLNVYCTSTGQNLRIVMHAQGLWFAPGGHDIWCANDDGADVYTIASDTLDYTNTVFDIEDGSWGCPWGSARGYRVTGGGWILGAGGKRLLMLPPSWQSPTGMDRIWNGNFLALLHKTLSEPVILEFRTMNLYDID